MESAGAGDGGRSLPMSKWMRKTERPDFMDMCASPPSDGFFYASLNSNNNDNSSNSSRRCERRDSNKAQQAIFLQQHFDSTTCNTFNEQHQGFLQSVKGSETSSSITASAVTTGVFNMDGAELEKWAKTNIVARNDDSAPSAVDHVPPFQRIVPKANKQGEAVTTTTAGGLRLVDRLALTGDDVTPSASPLGTPGCSPQVARKGNRFFTGDPDSSSRKEESSWLFRPAPKYQQDNMLYEAKVEITPATETQPAQKSVRYVPKPSQLRDLNFFSPTSM